MINPYCQLTNSLSFLNSYVSVIGLTNSSNGISCDQHNICGKVVEVDSGLHVRLVQAWRRGRLVDNLVAYMFVGGVDTCKGFLAKKYKADAAQNSSGGLICTAGRTMTL